MIKTLIVDDSASFRQSFAVHLYQRFPSMVITEAADGVEALEKVHTVEPNILFVDIQLPGQSGLELTRKIKTDCSKVVIAMLTAYDLPEYREAAQKLGADHFFSKSAPMEELEAAIQSVESRLK
jgi:DNA-binding NarL/FixJ family response regulator